MEDYLELLRAQSPAYARIAQTQRLDRTKVTYVGDQGADYPMIIPFRDDDAWSFAVAYPDCVHWYESRTQAAIPRLDAGARAVVTDWTGPKVSPDGEGDTGIIALLGIARLQQGAPHVSQDVADGQASSFRTHVLAAVACKALEPPDEALASMLLDDQQDEIPSTFFYDALYGCDMDRDDRRALPSTRPQRCDARTWSDDRHIILGNLCEAVRAYRSIQASDRRNLPTLWQSVTGSAIGSVFHERLNAVRFCEEMEGLGTPEDVRQAMSYSVDLECVPKMRGLQKQCEFWRDVCNLRRDWNMGKYVLLLALPTHPPLRQLATASKAQLLRNLKRRLDDETHPLETWLKQSQPLCAAIMTNSLPQKSLLIDIYLIRRHGEIDDADYEMYVNTNPQAKRALPR
ncbi:uncharacterized protein F5Z01DRAFT_693796 [Emericellopsis atlantica]|uniref:Uncharacterized protein n=1 Tax=Emericellopsis atlantica TaxID=2614577 RepID=A0A9P8CL57_9HYPO|nr:uncharacterized protein F5Z01DRAFT_693796 [Emericellopsis atlantica]KAG9250650.1 hypothetical protein F5Z01DRAFT_693796 [Emericellopsis atlantica]